MSHIGSSLDALLNDYQERNSDYRRYSTMYTTILTTIGAILGAGIGWYLSFKPGHKPDWLLPGAVGLANFAVIVLAFVYRLHQICLTYILSLEKAFNDLARVGGAMSAIHHADGQPRPSIAVGYYLWKRLSRETASARGWQWLLSLALPAFLLTLEVMALLIGFADPLFDAVGLRLFVLVVFVALPLGIALTLYLRFSRHAERDRQALLALATFRFAAGEVKPEALHKVVLADFKQRNEDARFLMNYYEKFLLWPATTVLALLGLWVKLPEHGWVFLVIPPVILAYAFGDLVVYRLVKRLKRYLCKVECEINRWLVEDGTPCLHPDPEGRAGGGFRLGLFSVIRHRHVQRMDNSWPPLPLIILNGVGLCLLVGLLVSSILKGLEWSDREPAAPLAIQVSYVVFVLLLVVANVLIFLSSNGIGKDPPCEPAESTPA